MGTTSDMPEWWEDVFTPREISDIQNVTELVFNEEATEIDTVFLAEIMGHEYVELTVELPEEQVPSILLGLREAQVYTKVDQDWQAFIAMLGGTLAYHYLESDVDYDEEVVDVATWFLPDDDDAA